MKNPHNHHHQQNWYGSNSVNKKSLTTTTVSPYLNQPNNETTNPASAFNKTHQKINNLSVKEKHSANNQTIKRSSVNHSQQHQQGMTNRSISSFNCNHTDRSYHKGNNSNAKTLKNKSKSTINIQNNNQKKTDKQQKEKVKSKVNKQNHDVLLLQAIDNFYQMLSSLPLDRLIITQHNHFQWVQEQFLTLHKLDKKLSTLMKSQSNSSNNPKLNKMFNQDQFAYYSDKLNSTGLVLKNIQQNLNTLSKMNLLKNYQSSSEGTTSRQSSSAQQMQYKVNQVVNNQMYFNNNSKQIEVLDKNTMWYSESQSESERKVRSKQYKYLQSSYPQTSSEQEDTEYDAINRSNYFKGNPSEISAVSPTFKSKFQQQQKYMDRQSNKENNMNLRNIEMNMNNTQQNFSKKKNKTQIDVIYQNQNFKINNNSICNFNKALIDSKNEEYQEKQQKYEQEVFEDNFDTIESRCQDLFNQYSRQQCSQQNQIDDTQLVTQKQIKLNSKQMMQMQQIQQSTNKDAINKKNQQNFKLLRKQQQVELIRNNQKETLMPQSQISQTLKPYSQTTSQIITNNSSVIAQPTTNQIDQLSSKLKIKYNLQQNIHLKYQQTLKQQQNSNKLLLQDLIKSHQKQIKYIQSESSKRQKQYLETIYQMKNQLKQKQISLKKILVENQEIYDQREILLRGKQQQQREAKHNEREFQSMLSEFNNLRSQLKIFKTRENQLRQTIKLERQRTKKQVQKQQQTQFYAQQSKALIKQLQQKILCLEEQNSNKSKDLQKALTQISKQKQKQEIYQKKYFKLNSEFQKFKQKVSQDSIYWSKICMGCKKQMNQQQEKQNQMKGMKAKQLRQIIKFHKRKLLEA